jgi:hypothetical protein
MKMPLSSVFLKIRLARGRAKLKCGGFDNA